MIGAAAHHMTESRYTHKCKRSTPHRTYKDKNYDQYSHSSTQSQSPINTKNCQKKVKSKSKAYVKSTSLSPKCQGTVYQPSDHYNEYLDRCSDSS